jgi:hypothetical protein
MLCHLWVQGTIAGHEQAYTLDNAHTFEMGRRVPVSGNTAAMLGEGGLSHLAQHFEVGACRPARADSL